ncbi:MAG TPA: hypothetical protein VIG99_14750, partial [Myxococcaceae bacterium]
RQLRREPDCQLRNLSYLAEPDVQRKQHVRLYARNERDVLRTERKELRQLRRHRQLRREPDCQLRNLSYLAEPDVQRKQHVRLYARNERSVLCALWEELRQLHGH